MNINNIYNIDCLEGMRKLENESIDLIYLDPPFFTQKKQKLTSKLGIEYFFEDSWQDINEYLEFLKIRFFEMKRILKKDGNIFVHCDKIANHKIRILLEEVFGKDNFRAEIIWSYKRWSNSKKGLLEGHQNIYHFSKSSEFRFNILYQEYSPSTNIDQILQMRERDKKGKSIYKKNQDGDVVYGSNKNGVPLNDVWQIPFLNPKAKERVGYPTQKPIELLEKILKIASKEGDTILDPFLGSGTTAVTAKLLKRNFIGFDINSSAIELAQLRLKELVKTESKLLKNGLESYENKTENQKKILARFECNIVQRNKGIDAILKEKIDDKLVGIKIQDKDETLKDTENLLQKAMKNKNFIFGIIVKTHDDLFQHTVSDNIIIIDDIDYLISKKIEKMEN
ncbi:DNA-methyltransferase [Fusobacterium polymorphum]|jgi:DNA methylase N-4/N-6 domain protein|uniref:Methyltransferase n=1 Tax=Fusobacterium nucleatum subsp. polymorphum TaxID=76857 RepID=A0A2C6CHM6_FUSNP|nr:site-specific DNA-methyltransferase [Fusobacterium polymorphum]PHI17508.1 site-specific DNA-methyltransferase [Fusobacterium polymorphum]